MRPHRMMTYVIALAALLLSACAPILAGTPEAGEVDVGSGPVLVWHREGGIAGFCDDLTLFADGSFTAGTCKGPAKQGTLTAEQQALLEDWLTRLHPFEVDETDPAVADAMTVQLSFVGEGANAATEADRLALQAFASEVHVGAVMAVDPTTPTPRALDPVSDEDRATNAAREALMKLTGVDLEAIRLVGIASQEWSDGCLGLGGPAESCIAVMTPGYRILLEADGAKYAARTNRGGTVVRFEPQSGTVVWEEAVALILAGRVTQVVQTHALTVILYLEDGSMVTTIEPAIDDVFDVISRCGDVCSDMILATE